MWNSNLTGHPVFVLIKSGNSQVLPHSFQVVFGQHPSDLPWEEAAWVVVHFIKLDTCAGAWGRGSIFLLVEFWVFVPKRQMVLGMSPTLPPSWSHLLCLHGFGIGGSQMHFQSVLFILWVDVKALRFWKFKFLGGFLSVHILCEKLGKALVRIIGNQTPGPLQYMCVCVCMLGLPEAFSEAQNEGSDYCGPNEPCQSGIICDNEISLCSGKAAFSGKCKLVAGCKILLPYARLCWHKVSHTFVPVEPPQMHAEVILGSLAQCCFIKGLLTPSCFIPTHTTEAFLKRISSSCFSGKWLNMPSLTSLKTHLAEGPSATDLTPAILRAQENRLNKRKHLQNRSWHS